MISKTQVKQNISTLVISLLSIPNLYIALNILSMLMINQVFLLNKHNMGIVPKLNYLTVHTHAHDTLLFNSEHKYY